MIKLNPKPNLSIVVVEVPANAKDPWIINPGTEKIGVNWYVPAKALDDNVWSEGVKLPPGKYSIIGKMDITHSHSYSWERIGQPDPALSGVTMMEICSQVIKAGGSDKQSYLILKVEGCL